MCRANIINIVVLLLKSAREGEREKRPVHRRGLARKKTLHVLGDQPPLLLLPPASFRSGFNKYIDDKLKQILMMIMTGTAIRSDYYSVKIRDNVILIQCLD